jgi:hypothetical protein
MVFFLVILQILAHTSWAGKPFELGHMFCPPLLDISNNQTGATLDYMDDDLMLGPTLTRWRARALAIHGYCPRPQACCCASAQLRTPLNSHAFMSKDMFSVDESILNILLPKLCSIQVSVSASMASKGIPKNFL